MNVWAVCFSEDDFTEDLYAAGLVLVDVESQTRIKRFYYRKDSYRCLLGRLLPRLLLMQHGVSPKDAAFGRTSAGKPFVSNPHLERTIGFNVSHDNEYIIMAFQTHNTQFDSNPQHHEDASQTEEKDILTIGVDVMKVALPRYEKSLSSFIQSISVTLTPFERRTLLEGSPDSGDDDGLIRGLRRLFLIWTLKEAYTKAIGLGMGFDFKRIEVDVHACLVSIDGRSPSGWEFTVFTLETRPNEEYLVAVARFTGRAEASGHVDMRGLVRANTASAGWFEQYDAASLIERISAEK